MKLLRKRGRMRLVEVICTCMLLLVFNGLMGAVLVPTVSVYRNTQSIEVQYERDKFISAEFTKLCEETEEVQWQARAAALKKMCCSLWTFDSFILEKKGTLFRAMWQVEGKTVIVYARKGGSA